LRLSIPLRRWGANPEFQGPKRAFRQKQIFNRLKGVLPSGKVLDVGCGIGGLSSLIAEGGYDVYGVDVTKENIEEASKFLPGKISYGDICDLPFCNEFDGLVCGEVVEHIKDQEGMVRNLNKILKLNGVGVISTAFNPKLWNVEDEWSGHVKRYTVEDFTALFERHNFVVEDFRFFGPLHKAYFFWFYIPLIKKDLESGKQPDVENETVKKATFLKWLAFWLFHFDLLFSKWQNGIYFIVTVRKKC